jgi:hypothetical protein
MTTKPEYALTETESTFLRQIDTQIMRLETSRQAAINLMMQQQGLIGKYTIDGGRTKLTPHQEATTHARDDT